MQPPLPDGSVPGTRPYIPAQPAPPGHLPGGPQQQAPQSNLTVGALALSLLLCFGMPVLLVVVGIYVPDKGDAVDAMLWCCLAGAFVCVGSLILAIIALASIRRSAGRTAMGVAAIVFTLLAPVTTLATLAMAVLLMAGGGAHGRPLRRRDGKPVVTPDVGGDAWTGAELPSLEGLDAATRAELSRGWLDDAALEHASIAAFGKLALDLVALGAPPALVAGAHRAALEEVAHARIAYTFASVYGGEPRSAGALPEAAMVMAPESRAERVARVVFESLVDGAVGEAAAARVAAVVAARTTDDVVADALGRIAREEATHAALADDVVLWCAALDPSAAALGTERAVRALAGAATARLDGFDAASLPGRASAREVETARREEARRLLARIDRPLADAA